MNPEVLMALHSAFEAIEDAGIPLHKVRRLAKAET